MNRLIVKSSLPFVLLLLFIQAASAQGYGNEWVIGTPNVLVSFDTTYHLDYFDISPNFCERELSDETDDICDVKGNIQFYYNGMDIISYKKYGIMDNGDSLDCCVNQQIYTCGSETPNASVIIPSSLDSNKYFVFQTNIDTPATLQVPDTTTTYNTYVSSKMLRHTVDMSQNNGEGRVISKNEVMFRSRYLLPRLTAVKHGNGRDWWLVGHSFYGNNTFYIWLIQNDSVLPPLIQQIGSNIYWDFYGKTTFSPDGSLLAMVTADDTVNVFDFDRCSGILSNARKKYIDDSLPYNWLNSCAFSADSRFLYTDDASGYIRQFDMSISNLDSSMELVGQYNFNLTCYSDTVGDDFGDMQLAPDGKIYITPINLLPCIDIINYPEVKGSGCDFVQYAFPLYTTLLPSCGVYSLPNMPNYQLGALVGSACDTLNGINNVSIKAESVKVFPNPANDIINVNILNGVAPDNISIIDVTGRVWKQFKPHQPNSQLSIAVLPQGVYFIQIQMATRVMVSKVVKE